MLAMDQRATFREIAEVNINRTVNIYSTNIRNITGPLCPPLMMCQVPFHPINIPGQIKFCNISPSTFLNLFCFFALVFSCTWLFSKSWFFSEIACVAITGPQASVSSHICSRFLQNTEDVSHLCFISWKYDMFLFHGEGGLGGEKYDYKNCIGGTVILYSS